MRQIPSLFLLLALSTSLPAAAQDETDTAEDFFADSPLILTVSRMAKPLFESPASVSVIDRQMIESSGIREIADIFRLVPGFVVGYHSGHAPAVSYHGLGQEFGRHIQVLIDGRSVFIPSFGGVPWSNLPLLIEDIERIEVIRGPNAVTYGANAFLATINIITRHAAEDIGARYSVSASDNANPDIEDAYLRVASQRDDIDWRLSFGTLNDEGFNGLNDSKRVGKANFRLDMLSRSNQFWTFQLGTSESSLGRGFPPSSGAVTDIERTEEASNSYLNLQWEGVWQSSSTIARLTHTRQEVTDNYDPGPFTLDIGALTIPGVTTYIDFDRISDRTDLELIHSDEIGEDIRLVYGGSLRRDKVKSFFLLNDNRFHEVDTSRLFGGIEWRFDENWLLDLGVMLEDSSLTSMEESPRISLIREFGMRHALRLVASKANRNPILWEAEGETEFSANIPGFGTVIVPTWVGNEDIEPEEIESYEIGLRSHVNSGLETDIKVFTYEITEQFVSAEVTVVTPPPLGALDVETNVNGAKTEVKGIEAALNYTQGPVTLNTGFSRVSVESNDEEFEDSIPEYTAFFGARYQFRPGHEISGMLYYLDEISWLDSGHDVPVARRLDLRYAYRLNNGISIEIIGQNLLEDFEDYEEENIHDQVVFLKLAGGF